MVGSDAQGILLLSYSEYRLSSLVLISLMAMTPLHTVLTEFTLIYLPNNMFFFSHFWALPFAPYSLYKSNSEQ